MKTEIAPLMIMTKLEQYDYAGATAVATVMLIISLLFLLLINMIQSWSRRHELKVNRRRENGTNIIRKENSKSVSAKKNLSLYQAY